jgi:hypothetical protein
MLGLIPSLIRRLVHEKKVLAKRSLMLARIANITPARNSYDDADTK